MNTENSIWEVREKAATEKKLWIRLSRVCNNKCVFCLDAEAQDGSSIPFPLIKQKLQEGAASGVRRVVLSGGEPTLHEDFLTIVEAARAAGYSHIQVITNGRMFSYGGFLADAVKRGVDEITFTMQGHCKELHEAQTQIPGSFSQSIKGLLNAVKIPGLIISIDIVINQYNYKYLFEIINFFISCGIKEFDLLQVVPFGRAWQNKDRVLYDIPQALPYLCRAFDLSKKPGIHLWTNRFPAVYLEGYEDLIQHPHKLSDEIYGRQNDMRDYLYDDKDLFCRGLRCRHCFLEGFCRDLDTLKKDKILYAKKIPWCIHSDESEKASTHALLWDQVFNERDIAWEKLINFYIDHRYFLKRDTCRECSLFHRCDGAPISYIRKKGFVGLRPRKPK